VLAAATLAIVGLHAGEPAIVPGVDLDWRAPPGCPDAAAIAGMVNSLLHRSPAPGPDPPRVRAVVSRVAAGRWKLRLDVYARRGHSRRIAFWDDCRVLARAAALLIAIHRDPLAAAVGLEAPAPPPSPPPRGVDPTSGDVVPPAPALDLAPETSAPLAPAAPEPAPSAPLDLAPETSAPLAPAAPEPAPSAPLAADPLTDAPSREPETRESPRPGPPRPRMTVAGHVRLDGGLDVGVLPGLGGHAGVFAGLSLRRVRMEAGLVGAPLRLAPGAPDGRFDRLAGAARVCPIWSRAAVTVALCVGAEAGAIHGVARDVERPQPRWAPWIGLTLSPAVRWRVAGPLGLYFAVDGVLALTRPRLKIRTASCRHRL
jgi:hypothetical protein